MSSISNNKRENKETFTSQSISCSEAIMAEKCYPSDDKIEMKMEETEDDEQLLLDLHICVNCFEGFEKNSDLIEHCNIEHSDMLSLQSSDIDNRTKNLEEPVKLGASMPELDHNDTAKRTITEKLGLVKDNKCLLCGKEFTCSLDAINHCEDHVRPTHICPKCCVSFSSLDQLKTHWQQKHEKIPLPKYLNSFPSDWESPILLDQKACLICKQKLQSRYDALMHYRNTHYEKDMQMCPQCKLGFRSKTKLKVHWRFSHKEIRLPSLLRAKRRLTKKANNKKHNAFEPVSSNHCVLKDSSNVIEHLNRIKAEPKISPSCPNDQSYDDLPLATYAAKLKRESNISPPKAMPIDQSIDDLPLAAYAAKLKREANISCSNAMPIDQSIDNLPLAAYADNKDFGKPHKIRNTTNYNIIASFDLTLSPDEDEDEPVNAICSHSEIIERFLVSPSQSKPTARISTCSGLIPKR